MSTISYRLVNCIKLYKACDVGMGSSGILV